MTTKVYGCSDDLIEVDGDVEGEVSKYGTDESDKKSVMLVFSDGTILKVRYCMKVDGIWGIVALKKGDLFDRIEECIDENANPHSDVAYFKDGVEWSYAGTTWEKVS